MRTLSNILLTRGSLFPNGPLGHFGTAGDRHWVRFIAEDLKLLGAIAEDPCVVGRLKKIVRKITQEPKAYKYRAYEDHTEDPRRWQARTARMELMSMTVRVPGSRIWNAECTSESRSGDVVPH